MGYSTSSNQPPIAITNRWWEDGQFGGETLWKTRTAYVGYEDGPRDISFTFPDLPTSNITINNILISLNIELQGDFKNRNGFVLTVAGTDYTAPPSQITIYSGWTEALSSQTLTVPMKGKYTPSRTSSEGGSKPSSGVYVTFTATAEWSYNYQTLSKPTNVSLSSTYITSSSSSTLSWDAVSNSPYANSVSGYQVYRDGQAYGQPTTGTSMSVSGAAAGTYYDFTVKAISDVAGYDSESSSSARLYVYGNDYSADLTLYTEKNSTPAKTIYIGDTGQSAILPRVNYETATYDSYSSYNFTQTTTTSGKAGTYTLTVYFSSGRSATSTAEVKLIGTPTNISFTTQPAADSVYGSNPGYKWSETTAENASSVGYWITNKAGTQAQEGVSYTQNILEYSNNEAFTISVQPYANGPYGGYTNGTKITSNRVYRANTIEAGTITTGIKGANIDDEEVANAYVFSETTLWWNYTPAEHGGNLASISYSRISTKDDNTSTTYYGGPETITSNNGSYGDNVGGLSKSTLKYTITFTDEYGQTYAAGPYTIEKLDAPMVEITGITGSTPVPPVQGATLHFIISPVGASTAADMRYKIEVGYGDEFYEVQPEKVWGNDVSCAVQFNVKTANAAGKLTTLYQALTHTDSAPLGKPILRYRLTAYDVNIPIATGVAYTTLLTDFTTKPILTGNLTITNQLNPSLDYASSQDSIKMSGVNVVHKNFFGDTTTDHLTNLLVRNGNTTLFNRALTEANYNLSYTAAFGEDAVAADTTYTYVYTVRKQYSDAITEDFKSGSLNMRRWIKPNITLTNLDWTTAGATPSIIGRIYSSTSKWGGSDAVGNIASIEVSISTIDGSGTKTVVRQYIFNSTSTPALSSNLIGGNLYAGFQIGISEMVDTQLIADIIITSITGQTYKLTTPQVLVKEQGIPFAIRRHGTGVNIPKGFNPATNEPAIQITGNMDTDNVATFTNGPNRNETCVIIQNDKGGAADTGKARLSLNKNDTGWTLSIFFD